MELLIIPMYLLILLGLVVCFFGYRLFRLMLILTGIVIGFYVGSSVILGNMQFSGIGGENGNIAIIAGAAVAVIGGIIGLVAYPVARFIAGVMLGTVLSAIVITIVNATGIPAVIITVIGLIVGIILAIRLSQFIVMLATAIIGAFAAFYGYWLTTGAELFSVSGSNPFQIGIVELIAVMVLAFAGFWWQHRTRPRAVVVA